MTNSENTSAMQKEMTRTYPNQSLDNLISLIILSSQEPITQAPEAAYGSFRPFPTSGQFGKLQNSRTLGKRLTRVFTTAPPCLRALFIQQIYYCFLLTIFPPIAQLHFLQIKPHTIHNSSNRSDEGFKRVRGVSFSTLCSGQY